MNIKEAAETFALNQWLSDYPVDWTYEQIIESIRSDDYDYDDILIWELIEDETCYRVVELIEQTKWAFERTVQTLFESQDQTVLSSANE